MVGEGEHCRNPALRHAVTVVQTLDGGLALGGRGRRVVGLVQRDEEIGTLGRKAFDTQTLGLGARCGGIIQFDLREG